MASLAAQAAASSSSSSLPIFSSTDHPNHYKYEVFLSFRGEDTRYGFTDHLHSALDRRGIATFRDDDKLRKGEDISQELLKAIEDSRVSIIVFSQTYASSRWCLDELVKILECRKSKGQEVRAVFYKVDPSDVRNQTGAFGDGFATLDQCKYKDNMQKWKAVLKEAADLAGWPFKNDEYETKFIDNIVGELLAGVVNPSCDLHVAEHPIGIESFSQEVCELLHVKENNVRMVGIWGPGGIGKTTIVKAVFNSIRHRYACSCFLAEVRSNSNDLAKLQKRLLVDVLEDSTLEVSSVDQGVSFIMTRMRHKKALIILDDVSHSSQLQKLVPSLECFGSGSRVLITTRDKRLLTAHEVDEVYEVKMLDCDRALKLFSLSAFKRIGPPGEYLKLAQRAIRYAQGLPLALIVLGSHLFRRSIEEWEAILDSSRREDPHIEIRDVLKISYDALGEDLKGYFLDIACFFKGEHVEKVKPILEACYDNKSVNGFAQLQEKALIRIDRDFVDRDVIWMHDLIREMGKDIVYQESPDELSKRSRLWSEEDINDVLTNNTGVNKVIGIQVPFGCTISLNAKSFSTMKNLKYLSMCNIIHYKSFSGNIDYLSHGLRWLEWPHCPLRCFPPDFHAAKLVYLSIPGSSVITHLWAGRKCFPQLTYMNLSDCESLSRLPDFTEIPNLKKLDLSNCRRLAKIPDSLGLLAKLVNLIVTGCSDLRSFPRIINWKSVGSISTWSCQLDQFPEIGEEMGSLRSLHLSGVYSEELHPSITNLIGLEEWDLWNCQHLTTLPHNIPKFCNLKSLYVHDCPKLAAFPVIPIKMDSLILLSLRNTGIRELDESIGNLIGLEKLHLQSCKNLRTLPSSICGWQNLEELDLSHCPNLVRFPSNSNILNGNGCSLSLPKLKKLDIRECGLSDCDFLTTLDCWKTLRSLDLSENRFVSLPGLTKFVNLESLDLYDCNRIRELPELPPKVKVYVTGCDSLDLGGGSPPLESHFTPNLRNEYEYEYECESLDIEGTWPSIEDDDEEEATPSSQPSLSSESSSVIPPEMAISIEIPGHHSTTPPQLQLQEEPTKQRGLGTWLFRCCSRPSPTS
ncbi:disease resistance protein RPV1-like [Argentina anserina]|uniref:disease resistance protein RPV1-like n=1 Tax=Argentina anserina TaxID=57926 RepID=UPI00217658E7|nr:disease resistance protein RPV1-like [Potentilla anserina]XP_050372509.1 disease resistance protein RPV1-like [Potentilla anserina]